MAPPGASGLGGSRAVSRMQCVRPELHVGDHCRRHRRGGESLGAKVKLCTNRKETAKALASISSALRYMHGLRLVHGDAKPSNGSAHRIPDCDNSLKLDERVLPSVSYPSIPPELAEVLATAWETQKVSGVYPSADGVCRRAPVPTEEAAQAGGRFLRLLLRGRGAATLPPQSR
eukprot:TRINITY_DN12911_c0_g1_i2.p1 TRINITY_DN12911_c0_g1~~TRINITY_DN12911_c0_g1_i2.p1  ORF type:complete len:194 (+),score=34.36 TRINITY_DN12911_c0_g1_i2:63-584(+)